MIRKYKIAKKVKPRIIQTQTFYISYQCPFCKTFFNDYNIDKDILSKKCSHCENKIIFEWS